ncbi:MAG: regulatory iron-sulfur-containing complex subunit RicT [candidate division WOR-3 bacterium]|nr:regulatory iron-sulfur-containing complex subunit RicT [candidate division WOR-3 bacterium]
MAVALVELHPFKSELCDIPAGLAVRPGDVVVIQDEDGEDVGKFVSYEDSDESRSVVLRKASEDDLKRRQELDEETDQALEAFCRLKEEHRLGMRVVGAHWRLDRKKICFYFASEERFDFRALHKAVSAVLDSRVAIKQIGVRDHARLLGGLGPCGRDLCCRSFVRELKPIALRMARQQNLFVEPSKISGLCGKLLCCLAFEDQSYQQWLRETPSDGSTVKTERGPAVVTGHDAIKRRVAVRYEDGTEQSVALEDLVPHPVAAQGRMKAE